MSGWTPVPEKFNLPATRGDVALIAIRLQRIITVLKTMNKDALPSDEARAYTAKILNELDESLEKTQLSLIGPDEVSS